VGMFSDTEWYEVGVGYPQDTQQKALYDLYSAFCYGIRLAVIALQTHMV
jgi:hypothetical protein